MEKKSIEKERVKIDYSRTDIPASVKNFMPDMYQDGDLYYCVLGTNAETGITGTGDTPEAAMRDWDAAFQRKSSK